MGSRKHQQNNFRESSENIVTVGERRGQSQARQNKKKKREKESEKLLLLLLSYNLLLLVLYLKPHPSLAGCFSFCFFVMMMQNVSKYFNPFNEAGAWPAEILVAISSKHLVALDCPELTPPLMTEASKEERTRHTQTHTHTHRERES